MAVAMVRAGAIPLRVSQPARAGLGRIRKIGLVGSHGASLAWTPWHDPSWELWAHASARGMYVRSPDRYFDLHRKECWTKSNNKGEAYLKWLASNPVPIYMQERFPEVPASVRYPLEQIVAECRFPYLTSHAAYMIALALMEGVTHLGFFGVNYGKSTAIGADCEYGTQRGGTEYWMGRAEALGVQLVIPAGCTLLAEPKELYGYASHDADGKLVESYTKRTWLKPSSQPKRPLDPVSGLEAPPPEVLAEIAVEAREAPRPPWAPKAPEWVQ